MSAMRRGNRIRVIIGVVLIALIVGMMFVIPSVRWGKLANLVNIAGTNVSFNKSCKLVQEQEFNPSDVHDIEVMWGSGDVLLAPGSGDKVVVREEALPGASGEMPQKAWICAEDGCLKVRWNEDGSTSTSLDNQENANRRVAIEVPSSMAALGDVSIAGTSGSYTVGQLGCKALDVSLTSGDAKLTDMTAEQASISLLNGDATVRGATIDSLDVSLTSGDADISGAFNDYLGVSAVSGDATASCSSVMPKQVDVSFTSGDVTLCLPQNAGFTADVSTVSGDFSTDFNLLEASGGNGAVTYRNGDGSASVHASFTSGDFELRKA